ncbi:MAG: peptidylprolyl isomerase [Desulfuromonadales bacterium]|nr:peptidylprolyl isomerase [Desulfuromonadales bacterium]NIS43178.1 peptidylprolyl isomerase [Desulfuromonadales bacterium]
MAQAKNGDRVKVNFTGKLEDGTVFDTTTPEGGCEHDEGGCEEGPLELTLGDGEFFEQVEEALVGMQAGETKTVVVSADDAFGVYDDDMVFNVPRDQVPSHIKPEVGQQLELVGEDDQVFVVTVVEVTDDSITIDANHPLTGEDLTFDLELLEVHPAA